MSEQTEIIERYYLREPIHNPIQTKQHTEECPMKIMDDGNTLLDKVSLMKLIENIGVCCKCKKWVDDEDDELFCDVCTRFFHEECIEEDLMHCGYCDGYTCSNCDDINRMGPYKCKRCIRREQLKEEQENKFKHEMSKILGTCAECLISVHTDRICSGCGRQYCDGHKAEFMGYCRDCCKHWCSKCELKIEDGYYCPKCRKETCDS
jgi:hypothetical protein